MPAKLEGLLDKEKLEDVNLNPTTWKPVRTARWSLDMVRPEFLALRRSNASKKPARSTAWLDGLRGFAAFLVFIHHNQLWAHGIKGNYIYENSFGYDGNHYFATLPFVRHFFTGGHFAVAIFFVISGYVLSVKSLSLIQQGRFLNAADTVGSALFRRWLRLYIPVIGCTLSWIVFRHSTNVYVDGLVGLKEGFGEDLKQWYLTFKNYSFVFLGGNLYEFPNLYYPFAWTIPIEFKGSIIVYTALSAFSRATRNARLWCEVGLIIYLLYIVDGYYGAMFMSGMLLCDLELLAQNDQLPRFLSMLSDFKELIFFHVFLVGMYLGGVPSADGPAYETLLSRSPGWKWLSHFSPQAAFDKKWFFLFWAAFITVASVPRLPWLKQFFETRFCQYLARISFALYLVHGYVMWVVGDRLYAAAGQQRHSHQEHLPGWLNAFPVSQKGPMGLTLSFWLPQLINLPVTLYVAEMVTKLFDGPSVKFSNWLYRKTLAAPSSPE